jgi:hypothetical protein
MHTLAELPIISACSSTLCRAVCQTARTFESSLQTHAPARLTRTPTAATTCSRATASAKTAAPGLKPACARSARTVQIVALAQQHHRRHPRRCRLRRHPRRCRPRCDPQPRRMYLPTDRAYRRRRPLYRRQLRRHSSSPSRSTPPPTRTGRRAAALTPSATGQAARLPAAPAPPLVRAARARISSRR